MTKERFVTVFINYAVYILVMSLYVGLLYAGIILEIEGAKNIAFVWVWIAIVTGLVLYIKVIRDTYIKKIAEKDYRISVPFRLAVISCIIVFLIWNGYIITGVFYILSMAALIIAEDEYKKRVFDALRGEE